MNIFPVRVIDSRELFPHVAIDEPEQQSATPDFLSEAARSAVVDQLLDSPSPLAQLEDLEAQLVDRAVTRSGGNLSSAVRSLDLSRSQLDYRLKKRKAAATE